MFALEYSVTERQMNVSNIFPGKHTGLKEDSYVDMQGGFSNSDDEDVPPPLPRKKSWDRIMQENKYVNVPLAENGKSRELFIWE